MRRTILSALLSALLVLPVLPASALADGAGLEVTVTAIGTSITYGDPAPSYTFSSSGFENGDDWMSEPSCESSYVPGHAAGNYSISCSGGDPGIQYVVANYVDGSLTVDPLAITVTAADDTIGYGDAAPAYTYTTTPGLYGDDGWTTEPVCTSDYAQGDAAGTYPINCSSADAGGNYTLSYTAGTLTVSPTGLTVTADDDTITYGDPAPTYGFTADLYGEDTFATDPDCTSDYTQGDPAGEYAITCTDGDAGANYTAPYTYVAGTLTVSPTGLTVTADDDTISYGDAAPAFTFSTTGLVGEDDFATDPTCTSDYVAGDDAGTYEISCSDGDAGADYTAPYTYVAGTLTVEPAVVTVTADDQGIAYGDPAPAYTYAVTGFLGEDSFSTDPTCAATYAPGDAAGTYPISCDGGDAGSNYTIDYVPGTLTVDPFELAPADPWYTGQTFYYTKSPTDTAVQVTLSASINTDLDPSCEGGSVADGRVTFRDFISGKAIATNVPIAKVGGSCADGIATAFATLSAGSYNVSQYVIVVEVSGSLVGTSEDGQIADDLASATIAVSVPGPKASGLFGAGELAYKNGTSTTELGTEGALTTAMGAGDKADLAFGFTYAKGGSNPKGSATLVIPGPDGSVYTVKTNSITSVTTNLTSKTATVYAKASVGQVGCAESCFSLGGASVRLDITDAGDLAGLTISNAKTSALLYANDFYKSGKTWQTRQSALAGFGKYLTVN